MTSPREYPAVETDSVVVAAGISAPWPIRYDKTTIWISDHLCYVATEAKMYKYDHEIKFAKILVKDGTATMKHLECWSID